MGRAPAGPRLVSERVGEVCVDGSRLEFTEYGGGDRLVVLLHGQLMARRMHEPLARRLAAEGYRTVTLDLLGHGRSDRPADPKRYSTAIFARHVLALLDHLRADRAVIGGTSLGANVSLEVALAAPERLVGMILEMPVLDNAVEAGIVTFGPLLFFGRITPWAVDAVRAVAQRVPRSWVPFWVGIGLDTLEQEPAPMAAALHGVFFGRIAPSYDARKSIEVPAIVIGHPHDPVHPAADAAMLAEELPNVRFVAARSIVEWRRRPERITAEVLAFLDSAFAAEEPAETAPRRRRLRA
ncbi:MAG TPA: alpha/beta fold hydrolase [Nocardioidaceae bacterium]|nr:alpha/beta fold hydrolase [Nocardioidaceae bacterium]